MNSKEQLIINNFRLDVSEYLEILDIINLLYIILYRLIQRIPHLNFLSNLRVR